MTPSSTPFSARDTRPGCKGGKMKTNGRTKTQMCFMATLRKTSKEPVPDRYRRYEIAKQHIPRNMSAREYEAEVKRLARKFKI